MRKSRGVTTAAALVALTLASASGAEAATEVGNNCIANSAAPGFTFLQLAKAPGTTPITTPAAGVVTKWRVNVIPFEASVGETLKVFRTTGAPNQFQAVGESRVETVVSGLNTFDTRIPVQAGDRFGVIGSALGTLFCETANAEDKMGIFKGNVPTGTAQTFEEGPGNQAAVSAIVEPDADADGYGDETQDKCPQSGAFQTECPVLKLDAVAKEAGRSSVTILVATSTDAPITVSGSVKLAGGSKKARSSAQAKLKAPQKTVAPGAIASFKLKFTKALKAELAGLPNGKSLKLKVKAKGKNVAGIAAKDGLTVKLKGQG